MNWRDRKGWFAEKDAEIIQALVRELDACATILEIGRYQGRSTLAIVEAMGPHQTLITIDKEPHEETERIISGIPNVLCIVGDSSRNHLKLHLEMIWIDGDHSEEQVFADLCAWEPYAALKAPIVFHDHDESEPGIERAARRYWGLDSNDPFFKAQRTPMGRIHPSSIMVYRHLP